MTLVSQVKARDELAFNQLYESFNENVYYWAYYYFTDREQAFDVIQDVFTIVWEKIDTIKDERAFYSWLRSITLNVCHRLQRAKKLDIMELYEQSIEQFACVTYTKEKLDYEFFMDTLQMLILSLQDSLRTTAFLHYIQEYEPIEISKLLHVPLGTIHSRLYRIWLDLSYQLHKHGYSMNRNDA